MYIYFNRKEKHTRRVEMEREQFNKTVEAIKQQYFKNRNHKVFYKM
jgi:hypothetical protein